MENSLDRIADALKSLERIALPLEGVVARHDNPLYVAFSKAAKEERFPEEPCTCPRPVWFPATEEEMEAHPPYYGRFGCQMINTECPTHGIEAALARSRQK